MASLVFQLGARLASKQGGPSLKLFARAVCAREFSTGSGSKPPPTHPLLQLFTSIRMTMRGQQAVNVIGQLRAEGVKLDPSHYNIAIRACVREGKFLMAYDLWSVMQKEQIPCNGGTYDLLLEGARRAGQMGPMVALRQAMEAQGIREPQVPNKHSVHRPPPPPTDARVRPSIVQEAARAKAPTKQHDNGPIPVTIPLAPNQLNNNKEGHMPIRRVTLTGFNVTAYQDAIVRPTLAHSIFGAENLLQVLSVRTRFRPPLTAQGPKYDAWAYNALTRGIKIGDDTYHFLGHALNAMEDPRERMCYFYKGTPEQIWNEVLPKFAALDTLATVEERAKRTSLLFSAVTGCIPIMDEWVKVVPDISNGQHIFTDGCGLVSPALAKELTAVSPNIWFHDGLCSVEEIQPTAFQIRYKGCKGMVVVAPELEGMQLLLRKSMQKVPLHPSPATPHPTTWQPSAWSWLACLTDNSLGQSSTAAVLLEHTALLFNELGVPAQTLIDVQTQRNTHNLVAVLCAMARRGAISKMNQLLECKSVEDIDKLFDTASLHTKFTPADPTLSPGLKFLGYLINVSHRTPVKRKPKTNVAFPLSRQILGIPEPVLRAEDGILQPGQCFVRLLIGGRPKTLVGPVAVFRNPTYHPGDIRVLQAVDVPNGRYDHLVELLTLPVTGERPAAIDMSGGDYDGDHYSVIWDPRVSSMKQVTPWDYTHADRQKQETQWPAPTMESMIKYFVQHIQQLGGQAHAAWLKYAMADGYGPLSPECLDALRIFQKAVDNKTSHGDAEVLLQLQSRTVEENSSHILHSLREAFVADVQTSGQSLRNIIEEIRDFPSAHKFVLEDDQLRQYLTTEQMAHLLSNWATGQGHPLRPNEALELARSNCM
eukprot:comp24042_c0_seq1/m.43086 comp24042_c0_seq1/g.43086  ORF comp24042_c0_seq1/g.43086 comp24042_c0_seq1/m.43086 type:complete len:876 (-) comp24042_c0_seq1:158-2785(-)